VARIRKDPYPPAAFYFSVVIGWNLLTDNSFQEVSGLTSELETEEVSEGGENRFVHSLPKKIKHPNLVLKRGIVDVTSTLTIWCKDVLERDFSGEINTGITTIQSAQFVSQDILVFLLDGDGLPLRCWSVGNALPVNWEAEAFNSTKNEVAVEKIEFKYNTLKRVL
jgi:phage tail-like protein